VQAADSVLLSFHSFTALPCVERTREIEERLSSAETMANTQGISESRLGKRADELNQAIAMIFLEQPEGRSKLDQWIAAHPNDPMAEEYTHFSKSDYINSVFPK
jgi:hypothetical protein